MNTMLLKQNQNNGWPSIRWGTMALLLVTLFFGGVQKVQAQYLENVGPVTVTSDKDDYAPRSNAVFTGAGFKPGEAVVLKVKNLSRACNTIAPDSSYQAWSVVADATGGFRTDWTVCDCPGDSLRLKAVGQISNYIAYAYFTDAAETVTITSPTSATSTSIPAGCNVTVNFTYSTSTSGPTGEATVSIKSGTNTIISGIVTNLPRSTPGNTFLPGSISLQIPNNAPIGLCTVEIVLTQQNVTKTNTQANAVNITSAFVANAGSDQIICSANATLSGNNPTPGSGVWTLVSGSGIIGNPTNRNTGVSDLGLGENIFRWTITNGSCSNSDEVTITRNATPTTATVLTSPLNICGLTSGSLGGNTATIGSGQWTQKSGPGTSTFSAPTSGSSTATATVAGTYIYTWTISNGNCTPTSADVTVTYSATPTTATVGATQNRCGTLTSSALGGNTPSVGSGAWTQKSGPGTSTFSAPTSGSSTATATVAGTYVYTWTISNGSCTPTSADVTVTYSATPTTATVGATQNRCGTLTSSALGGNTPSVGSGQWTQKSGPGTSTFSALTSGSSTATATVAGTYVYTWTISNGSCTPTSADVTVTYSATPTTATVGATQNRCGTLTSSALGGNTPSVGSGAWTQKSGPGTSTFSAPTSGSSTATATVAGTYVYTWTISNGSCTPTSADVTVTYSATPSVFDVTYTGSLCVSATIRLSGSEAGINYQLYRGGSNLVQTISGAEDGGAISFTSITANGTYTVVAVNPVTECNAPMNGSVVMGGGQPPVVYAVTGGGNYCAGAGGLPVGLVSSESGVTYRLYLNNTIVSNAVNGTGSAISFGNQSESGTYTVRATKTAGNCMATMAGSVEITAIAIPSAPTANNISVEYNGLQHTASATVNDGESINWFTTATGNVTTTAPSGTNFGTYTAWAEAQTTVAGCKSTTRTLITVTIAQRPLLITANDRTKEYGQTVTFAGTEFTPRAGDLVNGDAVSSVTLVSAGAAATATVAGSQYDITPSVAVGTGLGNYSLSYAVGKLTVTPKALLITANDRTKEYGQTVTFAGTEFTPRAGDLVNGDAVSSVTLVSAGAAATATVAGSQYDITPSVAVGTGLGNYSLSYAVGKLTVTPKALLITANDRTKEYGQTVTFAGTEFTPRAGDLVNGDAVSSVTLVSAGAAATATVAGSQYDITPSVAVGTGLGNYSLSYAVGKLTVTPKALLITANDRTKEYGQTVTFAGTEFTPRAGDLVNGDAVSSVTLVSAGAAATATVAGSQYDITPSVAVGTGLGNYSLSYAVGKLTVTPKALLITANDRTKEYGQTVTFAGTEFTPRAGDLVNGDAVSSVTLVSAGAAATATVAGSQYDITPSVAVGTGLGNYSLSYAVGKLTVTPKALLITANDRTKEYGQTVTFAGTEFTPRAGDLVNGDAVSSVTLVSAGAAATATVAGSQYDITPSVAVGTGLGNYSLSYAVGKLTVTPKALLITANDRTKEYGQTVTFAGTEFTPRAGDLVNGDAVSSVTLVSAGAAATATVAGSQYDITPSVAVGTGLGNYSLSYAVGKLTVTPKALLITANDRTKEYGQTVTFAGTEFTPRAGDLVNGDAVSSVTLVSAGAAATATVAGSQYDITPSVAVGTGLGNYSLSYAVGKLTVTPKALLITANDRTKEYGQTVTFAGTEFTPRAGDLVNGDAVSSVTLVSAGAAATATVAGSQYDITPSVAVGTGLGNYSLSYAVGKLTVTPKALLITANDRTKEYGQTVTFAGTEFTPRAGDLVNGDAVSSVTLVSAGAAATATVAGSQYDITPSVAVGTGLGNYSLSYAVGKLTVTPKALLITANDRTKEYGQTVTFAGTEFTPRAGDLVNGDAVSSVTLVSAGAAATATVAGSQYDITPSVAVGTGLGNYSLSYAVGKLTVNKAPLLVTVHNTNRVYGGPWAAFTGTVGATKNGDVITANYVSTVTPVTATVQTYVNEINAVPEGAKLANYEVTIIKGNLEITKASSLVATVDKTMVFNSSNFDVTFTATITGPLPVNEGTVTFNIKSGAAVIATGTSLTVANNLASKTIAIPGGTTIGDYTIEAIYNPGNNYFGSSNNTKKLSITAASSAISVQNSSVQYSDKVALTAVVTSTTGQATINNTGGIVTFKAIVNGSTINLGTSTTSIVEGGVWRASGNFIIPYAPGSYSIFASFVSNTSNVLNSSCTTVDALTVNKENAAVEYTGGLFVATSSSSSTSALVTLTATVRDVTAYDAVNDPNAGDIRYTKVRFKVDGNIVTNTNATNGGITDANGWMSIGLVNSGDTKTGTALVKTSLSIGSGDAQQFTVVIEVGGPNTYYVCENDEVAVTVYKPLNDFIVGGGYIKPTGERKTNFGFNVKYNKSGKSLQGNINVIFRKLESDGIVHIYQIKGNSMISLGVESTNTLPASVTNVKKAVFNGKANMQDITNQMAPVSLGGNLTLQVTMTDKGEPGSSDLIGITVYDNGGGIVYSSKWNGIRTDEVVLNGGNIVVNSGAINTTAATATPLSSLTYPTQTMPMSNQLSTSAFPNPAINHFNLKLSSNNTADAITLRVYNQLGQVVDVKRNLFSGQTIQVGAAYKQGTYFAEVTQGVQKQNLQLVKTN